MEYGLKVLEVDEFLNAYEKERFSQCYEFGQESQLVLAQVSGSDKSTELIKKLRDDGHVVAYVGDQIDEIKVLNAANIGISGGYSSDLVRHNSDVTLYDNSLATLTQTIGESHKRFVNL